MRNYFNYFTEIEDRFQQRRGSILMLSTLDWALIESWRESGIPLEAVLRGIDDAFDKHDIRKEAGRLTRKKINGLAWCAQSVMHATEAMADAAVGIAKDGEDTVADNGFERERIAAYLESNAGVVDKADIREPALSVFRSMAQRLRDLSAGVRQSEVLDMEDLERSLTVQEEKMYAALRLSTPEADMEALKEQSVREIAPYRSKMQAAQLRQVQDQFLNKRLLEMARLPRLSLFYMSHG